nr:hypothetical protein [Fusobacterium gastrosuis]
MIYKCKKCKKFLANIRSQNLMTLKGKSIEFTEDSIIIKCKCGEENIIKLKRED